MLYVTENQALKLKSIFSNRTGYFYMSQYSSKEHISLAVQRKIIYLMIARNVKAFNFSNI